MVDIPKDIKRERLVSIIGNILDNSFEAVLTRKESQRLVKLSITDLGNDLIFEFDDSGKGVPIADRDKIFTKGFSTKTKQGHGMGLFLVEKALSRLQGSISVGSSELGGAAFTVIIPKKQRIDETDTNSHH